MIIFKHLCKSNLHRSPAHATLIGLLFLNQSITSSTGNDSFFYYFFRLILALAVLFTAAYAITDVTNPSENAPKAVVAAAATIPPSNENIRFSPFSYLPDSIMFEQIRTVPFTPPLTSTSSLLPQKKLSYRARTLLYVKMCQEVCQCVNSPI